LWLACWDDDDPVDAMRLKQLLDDMEMTVMDRVEGSAVDADHEAM
jgi:hypothetical protein